MKKYSLYKYICGLLLPFIIVAAVQAQTGHDTAAGTLSLEDYLNRVGKSNLTYLSEQLNVKMADAEIIAQKVLPDPELNFEALNENFVVELGYTVELGNKRGARVRLARSEAELARLNLTWFFEELRAEATDAFLEAIFQRERLDMKKSSYEYMLQLSRSDSIRFRSGEITENDVRQSRLEAATLLNEVYQQEAEYKAALVTLNQYMGHSTDTLSMPVGSWDSLSREYILSDLIASGLTRRLDLVAASKKMEVANNQIRLARAERKMDVDLMVGYERDWKGVFPARENLKAGLTIPLKFSNINKGSLKFSRFQADQKQYDYRNTQLEVETSICQAYYYFEAAQKQVAHYRSGLLDESKKVLDGMVYTYRRGESGILDVLIAQRTYNEVQEQYLEVMKGYVSSLVNLQKTCGMWDIRF